MINDMKQEGMSETEIAKALDISTTQLRARKSIASSEERAAKISRAQALRDKGYSYPAIAKEMGLAGESSVRSLLAPGAADRASRLQATADILMKNADEKSIIDVGGGVETHLGVSKQTLNTSLEIAKENGYGVHALRTPQLGTKEATRQKVLVPPGMEYSEVLKRKYEVRQINEYSDDAGKTFDKKIGRPKSIDSKRVGVNYAEDGGKDADGVIYVRPGVEDISLGGSKYAQVRIAVDGTHYLKGMAMYKTDMPDGVDLMFNTNKSKSDVTSKMDAFKPMQTKADGSIDKDNPFNAYVRRQKGVMNILDEEGSWHDWSRTLSSQVLSKQTPQTAKNQLDIRYEGKRDELDEILSLTNPTVRKKLLDTFADGADSSAVTMEAAAMPRQAYHVILPINSLKSNEVYAPQYDNGEEVVLIRYPHGGIFEIPKLKVNNKHQPAIDAIGKEAIDAIGINAKVADRLSGADFDGDTVLVIPNGKGRIKTTRALEELKDFEPKVQYRGTPTSKKMTNTQAEMGKISNLITDMTIQNASQAEIARAVRHSMVVIDAEKHGLDYTRSSQENAIIALRKKYQQGPQGGASTIVSRAKSPDYVPARRAARVSEGGPINKKTGERNWVPTGEQYVSKKTGKLVTRMQRVTKLGEAKDAYTLSSGTVIEGVYAGHYNRMKALANEARRESVNTKVTPRSKTAERTYRKEVTSLNSKLTTVQQNRPRERQAQVIGNAILKQKKLDNPTMDDDQLKKQKRVALEEGRRRAGAKRLKIDITPREWEAIQAGAISNNKLTPILNNSDLEQVKEYATPRTKLLMSGAKTRRAERMAAAGYTQAEIASQLGVSTSTLYRALSG